MISHKQAQAHARAMMSNPDDKQFLEYVIHNLCGVGQTISGVSDSLCQQAIGKHNVGVEIKELTKERKAE